MWAGWGRAEECVALRGGAGRAGARCEGREGPLCREAMPLSALPASLSCPSELCQGIWLRRKSVLQSTSRFFRDACSWIPTARRAPPRPAGAELGNVLNEGALEAVRRRGEAITQADINNAVDRVLQVGALGFLWGIWCAGRAAQNIAAHI